jgi:hypothetical protein
MNLEEQLVGFKFRLIVNEVANQAVGATLDKETARTLFLTIIKVAFVNCFIQIC